MNTKLLKILLIILNILFLIGSIILKNHLYIVASIFFLIYILWIFRKWKKLGKKKRFTARALASCDIIFFFIMIFFLRIYKVQIIDNGKYQGLIRKQVEGFSLLKGKRGTIYNKNGREIVYDISVYDIIIDPYMLSLTNQLPEITTEIVDTLSLNRNKKEFIDHLLKESQRKKRYNLLDVNLNLEEKKKIEEIMKKYGLRNNEIILKEENERTYYRKEIYENIVGVLGLDSNGENLVGISGIEKEYESYLKPKNMKIKRSFIKNRKFTIPTAKKILDISSDGKDLYLTIEDDLQYILNDEIKKQFEETDSEEAYGIIVDPNTGAILALSSFHKNPHIVRNPLFQNQVEPGSIFKPIIVAGALNDGYITEDSIFDIGDGRIKKYGHTIKEATRSLKGELTVKQILEKSSNVGMVMLTDNIEDSKIEEYLDDFGFYNKTNIDFPYERKPYNIPSKKWDKLKKSTISFGQGIVVTPIQMIMAFSSLVNGGKLYKPYLIEKIIDSSDSTVIRRNIPEVIKTPISKETSEKMKKMLEDVVESGGGEKAKVEGYTIGGKTGTAQISAGRVGYLKEDYLTSFIGFFPVNKPKYVGLIMFYKPNVDKKFGGLVAAPVFGNVIKRLTMTREIVSNNISKITITQNEIQDIRTEAKNNEIYRMPDLKGKTLREVVDIFSGNKVNLKIEGTGIVKEFYPPIDTELSENAEIKVILK